MKHAVAALEHEVILAHEQEEQKIVQVVAQSQEEIHHQSLNAQLQEQLKEEQKLRQAFAKAQRGALPW